MGLSSTGLTVPTEDEIISSIETDEQENISASIEVDSDTVLGQLNQIFAAETASVNQLLQDIYDQRNIYVAEGKALDDILSWLGISRQGATATSGEQFFEGDDSTIISAGSYVQNESTLESYTLDAALNISKDNCRICTIDVSILDDGNYDYTVSVKGIFSTYQSQGGDTQTEIIAGLVSELTTNTDGSYTATDNLDDTLTIAVTDNLDTAVTIDSNLFVKSVVSAGQITGINTGELPAPIRSVVTILSPVSGWKSTYNPEALILGRSEETDAELRARAISFRSSSGKATVDSIKAALLDLEGVSSVSVNERFVSKGVGNTDVEVDSVIDSTLYTVTIDGQPYTFTSGVGATNLQIAAGLVLDINTNNVANYYSAVDNLDGTFYIQATVPKVYKLDVSVDANLSYQEGQPAGSIQIVVAGGLDDDAIAQVIWDTKPAGVEVWAVNGSTLNTGTATDDYDEDHVLSFNRPVSILMTTTVTYNVFDSGVYPLDDQDAYDAIKAAIVTFGNALGAGEDVVPSEFEGTVYGAVGGIYNVIISMTSVNGSADSENANPNDSIPIATDEEAFFDSDQITVTKQ